jgi:hypothetical protein
MANLATQAVSRTGLNPSYSAAAGGGDTFTPDSDTFLHVKNGHTASQTVTIVTPRQVISGVETADLAVSVPNAGERMIGPFPAEIFADPSDGLADLTYSGVTALTIAVVKVA